MEKLQYECNEYKLYSPDSLKYITDNMHNILLSKISEYKKLFNINHLEQIQINYFDDLNKFREFIYEIRGEKESLPEYARGTYDNGMINAYMPTNLNVDSQEYKYKLYNATHELFHIMYMKYILKNDYSKRIVWYDEGMAQYFSGENDYLLNEEKFKKYYLHVKENTKITPEINSLEHGNSFCNDNYDGYDLSYLAVRYLHDTLNKNDFKELMSNFDLIKKYGQTIINDMFLYYDKILLVKH